MSGVLVGDTKGGKVEMKVTDDMEKDLIRAFMKCLKGGCDNSYPQEQEINEYRYIDAAWLDAVAAGLTAGQIQYPGETWRVIPAGEHMARAMRHINLWRKGDRSEPHIINASMRLMMAFVTEVKDGEKEL